MNLTPYLDQYGYIILFFALMLELIALPMPGEILMSYTGFLVFQGHLNWGTSILVAGVGSCIGMTIAYGIGYKLGTPFFERYGRRFHMGPERIEKTSLWFSRHGNKLLIIAYFIPGVRHITGYFSGITKLPFRTYALFAYSGAFIWVTVFITLGKILGPQWEQFHNSIKKYLIIGGILAAILIMVIYIYKKYRIVLKNTAIKFLDLTLDIFHTRKRVGLLIALTGITTLGLTILMIGMIQDFLGNEFLDFNEIVGLLVSLTFHKNWTDTMQIFSFLGSRQILFLLIFLTLVWIIFKGRDKKIVFVSVAIVTLGGELYEESLRRIFNKLSPINQPFIDQLFYAFPSEQSLMAVVIYGFFLFVFVRSTHKIWVHTFVIIAGLIALVLIAISRLYLEVELPSDVAAGYVFGGVWLGLNILSLEIFRLLKSLDAHSKT
ncbi:VTT domain-containing protein [Pseudoneobacillus sp. C159]